MNNAELIARLLEEAGVRWVFGIPSGPVLPLIEALHHSRVRFVLTASETSAGFMAQTVGSLTGVPGVCVATLGPGATNLATGVGAAWLDRSPLVAITCNVPAPWLKRRVQMRIDHNALFRPLTKATFALDAGHVATIMERAVVLARAEPPGPVHLDLPEDVALDEAVEAAGRVDEPPPLADLSDHVVQVIAAALGRSRRPLVLTGLTFTRCGSGRRLLSFIETHKIPFVSTLHAKGFLPESHPYWAGVIGRACRSEVERFTRRADLIIAIGYDPVEINYEEWVGTTPVIHVSTEAADGGAGISMLYNRACDLDRAIEKMGAIVPAPNEWSSEEIGEHREALERSLRPDGRGPAGAGGLAPHRLLDLLRRRLSPDAILTYDVGAHTHQIATQWRTDFPRTCLATNGWSSMGYGIPAAYAAKLVYPRKPVVAVVGDGCFQMTVGELALARRLALAVPVIVLNDGWLTLMKIKQERKGYGLSGVYLGVPADSPPHYFGVPCRAARDERGMEEAIDWALNLEGPSVIEALVDVEPYSDTVLD
ncbi:MAG: thiamine pyrophosphate-binding protein [Deltaproteobacteria bacterium]|nr:thiamine pyrophosphate-binding protein [Deltaproteobacteria bacterium]